MLINTKYRSTAPEIMDDFELAGETLRDALDKIASINRLLGGNKVTLNGVKKLIANTNQKVIRIIDVGCGNGDMLRALADYGKKNNLNFELKGIDANSFTLNYARKLSVNYTNINYKCTDIFNDLGENEACDIMLCTLTLHHFTNENILKLLQKFMPITKLGLVINDLNRSAVAYYLFTALCFVFRLNKMSKDDGLISILRGFKKTDLINYSKQLQLKNYTINWKWAFRYQWTIKTT